MRLEINLPNGRWFKSEWLIRPKIDSYCAIIVKHASSCGQDVFLAQYMGGDLFFADGIEDFEMSDVEWWQPIDLPAEFERQINDV